MASPGALTFYTGVTSNLEVRVHQHKSGETEGFASKYNCTMLVYYEELDGPKSAIEREKQIKGWRREKKVNLIRALNPEFKDLSDGWYDSAFHGNEGGK